MTRIKIHMTGAFKVEGPDGEDLTPKGAKDCGLLALLVQSRSGERARAWLQAMLWSDRGKDQAAASLRQVISKIRKSFGPYQSVLLADRRMVGLNLAEVEVVFDTEFEFLEGIDVRDQEFELWLAGERSAHDDRRFFAEAKAAARQPQTSTSAPNVVWLQVGKGAARIEAYWWIDRLVGDMVAKSLSENFSVDVHEFAHGAPEGDGWRIDIESSAVGGGKTRVRVSLMDVVTARSIWSGSRVVESDDGHLSERIDLVTLIQELTFTFGERVVDTASVTNFLTNPDALCHVAIRKLFTMRAEEIVEADELFRSAFEIRPRGLYLAWRAQVREIQFVERTRSDTGALRDEAEAFARQAFEAEPQNSMVLALMAVNRLHMGGDVNAALQFAKRAVRANFGNAMAWWGLSAAHLISDDPVKSYGCARMAAALGQGTPMEFWTLSQLSGAAMATRKLDEAKAVLKTVNFGRPQFRPPLRYLLALHATDQEWEQAMQAARQLKNVEPDFSIDKMINDGQYPVSLLRGPYGLDKDKLKSLI